MNPLSQAFAKHGTDKGPGVHNYGEVYYHHLQPFSAREGRLLEIGVQGGHSLRAWSQFLPKFQVLGVDNNQSALEHAGGNIKIRLADQADVWEMRKLAQEEGPFDVVVDDGSHVCAQRIASLTTLLPFVKPGGLYIIEDLLTSYWPRYNAGGTTMNRLKTMLDDLMSHGVGSLGDIRNEPFEVRQKMTPLGQVLRGVSFYHGCCVIQVRED